MKRQNRIRLTLFTLAALSVTPVQSLAQEAPPEWHPALKELWQDLDDWRLITPDDVDLGPDRLVGLRAVYHREESLLSNPLIEEAGFQFEKGWLRGEPILIGRFYTSGDPDRPESGPSTWTTMLEPASMRSLGMTSSSIRWGGFATRVDDTKTTRWSLGVDSAAWSEPEVIEDHEPMIELAVWGQALAGLPLEEGMKFRLQSFPNWIGPAFHVAGRTEFADTRGRVHNVWAVETNMGTNGWIGTTYISTDAPVFIGFEMKHVETGEVNLRWRLKSYRWLGVD